MEDNHEDRKHQEGRQERRPNKVFVKAAQAALARNRKNSVKVRAGLRHLTCSPGYGYLKDIAMSMADALIVQIPATRGDNRSQIGAVYRQAFLRLFAQVEAQAGAAPKVETEMLLVEKHTEVDNL